MADTKGTDLTELSDLLGSDLIIGVDSPESSPITKAARAGDVNLLPDGWIINGGLSVTVASNNITVALKTKAGADPSATDPVSIWLGGTFRRCTAALSVTKNAGTNWFNAGAAELAAKEVDYFAYVLWNTTPATDIMDIGFARIPYGRVYSDFSGTSTAESYLAFGNASTPTSTDACTIIGRFAATLSAAASYNWSVPAYTSKNLIQYPIRETRLLSYAPTLTGYSGTPTATGYYNITGTLCRVGIDAASGTSNGTGWTATLPLANGATCRTMGTAGYLIDNGSVKTTPGRSDIVNSANTIVVYADMATGSFTASGTKTVYVSATYSLT